MLDFAIQAFLDERKAGWLKKKINNNTSDEEKYELEQQALNEFSLATWLPNAAKRAGQLYLVSHPGKFSHPSAKISSVIARAEYRPDGFLRTGNVNVELDVFGNAAAMDVYKFLSIKLSDDQTILQHLESQTEIIKSQLSVSTASFHDIEEGLLAIKQGEDTTIKTSGKIKQVYFPTESEYHLLSILTPSGIMYQLKERINVMRFSDEAKEVREAKKKNHHHERSLSEIYGLSAIGFGGTKPQNISVLNSQNGGVAYLLFSMPPQLEDRKIRPPKKNFFSNTLWIKMFTSEFENFHLSLVTLQKTNNIHNRKKRDRMMKTIIYQVIDRLWLIRSLPSAWSDSDIYQHLSFDQKIWLDQKYKNEREKNTEWLDSIKNDLARWFINAYLKVMDKKSIELGDDEIIPVKKIISECEEGLK